MNLFQNVERSARDRGLTFVVIGGLAVIEHGYSRLTTDFDLLVSREQKEHWHGLLVDLGYELTHERETFRQYTVRAGTGWPVDLMLVNQDTFTPMLSAAKMSVIQGANLPLAALEHLLALKLHALKHSHLRRFLKDFQDVVQLVSINKIDLNSPHIRDLFLKYGNSDLYDKIRRACENQ